MALQGPNHRNPLYPEVMESNPDDPSIDKRDLVENLSSDNENLSSHPTAPPVAIEEVLITIPGAILNLIDNHYSVELACGDLNVVRIQQGDNVVAVLARVADEIQWPLAKDEVAVKLDDSHYFFSLRTPKEHRPGSDSSDEEDEPADSDDLLNYGVTIASKGQENLVKDLDGVLQSYSSFSIQKVSANANIKKGEALDVSVAREVSPAELKSEMKKELMKGRCAAYWTTLAPNVEDYSGTAAMLITAGSGKLIKGFLWCGDVTVDRLKVGNEVMKKRINPRSSSEIDPKTLKRIKRVKRVTKMTEKVATEKDSPRGEDTISVTVSGITFSFSERLESSTSLGDYGATQEIIEAIQHLEIAKKACCAQLKYIDDLEKDCFRFLNSTSLGDYGSSQEIIEAIQHLEIAKKDCSIDFRSSIDSVDELEIQDRAFETFISEQSKLK